MQIELKMEILKVFSLQFSFCSDKKEKKNEEVIDADSASTEQPGTS